MDKSRSAQSKGAQSKGAQSKGAQSKGSQSKGAQSKGAQSKGAQPKGAQPKGAQSKDAQSKDAQSKGNMDQPTDYMGVGAEIGIKELAKVALGEDERVNKSGKWPLVVDCTGPAELVSTFLRHRDASMLDTINPAHMQTEAIRLAVLGALRYGKLLVLDMHETDNLEHARTLFDCVQEGLDLMGAILDKSVMQDEVIETLVRPGDNKMEYSLPYMGLAVNFQFMVLTSNEFWAPGDLSHFFRVKVQQ